MMQIDFNKIEKILGLEFNNLDLLIHENGMFSYKICPKEIAFPVLIDRIIQIQPKKTILTHIEECELRMWGLGYLKKMKKKLK